MEIEIIILILKNFQTLYLTALIDDFIKILDFYWFDNLYSFKIIFILRFFVM